MYDLKFTACKNDARFKEPPSIGLEFDFTAFMYICLDSMKNKAFRFYS